MGIENCEGYRSLRLAVDKDLKEGSFHDYEGKFNWVIGRCKHYSDATGVPAADILNAWESRRNYWYMSYYQEAEQPEIKGDRVRVFDTLEELKKELKGEKFQCPNCDGLSSNPYECDSGIKVSGDKACDWKVYGLFRSMGKGVYVFIKEKASGEEIFMPDKWKSAQ